MEYFLLKQDERYVNIPKILDIYKNINVNNINLTKQHKIDDIMIFYIKSDEKTEFLDVLSRQLFLISENVKNILEKYNANIVFKMFLLIDRKNSRQEIYYLPIFEEIQALSKDAELNLNKTVVKKLILNEERIANKKIFKIKESSKTLVIVRLDVAESLLRRDFKGIILERAEIRKQ